MTLQEEIDYMKENNTHINAADNGSRVMNQALNRATNMRVYSAVMEGFIRVSKTEFLEQFRTAILSPENKIGISYENDDPKTIFIDSLF